MIASLALGRLAAPTLTLGRLHNRFVVKTTDQEGRKVFINICSSDKVPVAGSWANGKVHCCTADDMRANVAAVLLISEYCAHPLLSLSALFSTLMHAAGARGGKATDRESSCCC